MNGNKFLGVVCLAGLLLFGAVTAVGAWADLSLCNAIAKQTGVQLSWEFLEGCAVKAQDGTVYLRYYRFIRTKPHVK